ncbi:MAG: hypothetical protein M3345_07370 [Actinomycetota bacterium]|nr:hypothetical protein [Actinomycetota bacterium]
MAEDRRDRRRRAAWSALGAVVIVYAAGVVLGILNLPVSTPARPALDPVAIGMVVFAVVGAPVALRQPQNPIGWILLAISLSWGMYFFCTGYAIYGVVRSPGSVPRPDVVLALQSWLWIPSVGLMGTFLILLFPDGRLPSPRWRPFAMVAAAAMAVTAIATLLTPGSFANDGFPNVRNPLGLESLGSVMRLVSSVGLLTLLLCIGGSAIAVIMRFRRSRGHERLQMKWLASAGAAVGFAYLTAMSAILVIQVAGAEELPRWFDLFWGVTLSSFFLIPISIGIAILRHRLYDIDVLVNRALVYGGLTLFLGMLYVGGVVGVGTFVQGATGDRDSPMVVAGTTLAVAAAFRPARAWMQRLIDRRFFRERYDATQTIEAFSARLREEVDIESMTQAILAVVQATMQPRQASLWLKDPPD